MAATKVIMIDNYDSFTWNIYEYLSQEGADVKVFRNDKITIEEINNLNPDILLISPGPGHPKTDSGISRDAIKYFAGKLPIFGVCMGQQCMFEVFGGEVAFAGEIVHGKTSPIFHDNKGIFKNVPQGVLVTRYHSLAGTNDTLPDELEITAKTNSGVIMGIRHKKYTIEGVQFHPESILTEEGHLMIKNMLNVKGGTWDEYNNSLTSKTVESSNNKTSILDRIYEQRRKDIAEQSSIPGLTFKDLEVNYKLGLTPPVQDFGKRLQLTTTHTTNTQEKNRAAVIAEIKRASPSKGDINIDISATEQALIYANSNASAISVLTEPHWFKGQLQDLVNVRKLLDLQFKDKPLERPCILRKEFIFSKYQILEARLSGADTVLLIVKMLKDDELKELYDYSTKELGMEPLVEINSKDELDRAIAIGAKIIGVNNRNLHSFNVDLNTTSNLIEYVPKDTILIALSGILSASDADNYKQQGVHAFLVGEALMKSSNVKQFINDLCK